MMEAHRRKTARIIEIKQYETREQVEVLANGV